MSKEVKARVLLVKVPKEKIGLFTALIDGSGRYAIVRTREKSSDEVYLIATPDTFSGLLKVLEEVRSLLPELYLVGEVESIDVG